MDSWVLFRRTNDGTLNFDTEGLMRASGLAAAGPLEGGASLRVNSGRTSPKDNRDACTWPEGMGWVYGREGGKGGGGG